MLISDFDYTLPAELIAQYPTPLRTGSRLLEVGANVRDRQFTELCEVLRSGDLLVFNDTRVIKARLRAIKETGGRAEILVERLLDEQRALAHIKASKAPKPGGRLHVGEFEVEVLARHDALFELRFSCGVLALLDAVGEVPLPPYLNRIADESDDERYQTVYARKHGAVAAPTAGLHFDDDLLRQLAANGVRSTSLTLHVGAGTFQSLREEDVDANRLHRERVVVADECVAAVNAARASGNRVVAVGTTSVRSLECASSSGELRPFDGETDLFIRPGYAFKSVDAMLTNFHLPQSSLLMLVAAFAGRERILSAYRHAVAERYRFFSYGDAMFLTPGEHTK